MLEKLESLEIGTIFLGFSLENSGGVAVSNSLSLLDNSSGSLVIFFGTGLIVVGIIFLIGFSGAGFSDAGCSVLSEVAAFINFVCRCRFFNFLGSCMLFSFINGYLFGFRFNLL